ncbi:MAG: hypothetical protein J7M09_01640 [Deltaproteobacteria bacterium]|nr:hypothetical protein [Candidatus Tharpella sp.]
MTKLFFLLTLSALLLGVACNTKHEVQVAPVEIKPIHITIDVNIKVDRALDDFFGDLDAAAQNNSSDTNQPASEKTDK